MNAPIGFADKFYQLILRLYPSEYLQIFGDEMQTTFDEGLHEARSRGALASFLLRELRDTPGSVINAYASGWKQKLLSGVELLQEVASSSDLPPAPPDGRESWRQVIWELSLFLIAGIFLMLVTYSPRIGLHPGWQHDIEFLGMVIVPIITLFLIIGLAKGLPRWTYPLGGLLLAYFGLSAGKTGLWLFLAIMLLASSILSLATILTDSQPSRLPVPIRRIAQSLSLDWTRLSFGVYGAMPLIILSAFNDAHINSRTPYFAFSILVMVVCALVYCRSRDTTMQLTTLLAGLTFSVWGGWLDKVSFTNGLMNWTIVSSVGLEAIAWMAILWIQWAVLILFPIVFILLTKLVHLKRAV